MSEIADILDRAADLIEPEGAWTQGALGRDAAGAELEAYQLKGAVCFCASGALLRAGGERWGEAAKVLWGMIGAVIPHWNDAPERTQAEVVATFREAAAKVRTPQYALKNGRV